MSKQNLFEVLGPGKSFAVGIVTTLLVIFSIGFFILLFSGDNSFKFDSEEDSFAAFNQPSANQPSGDQAADQADSDQVAQINIASLTTDDHVRGNISEAEVVVVEFSDYECPYCNRFHPTMEQIVSDYGGKVAWVYRHFPLDSIHPEARGKAEAAECVGEVAGNDGFWEFSDALYEAAANGSKYANSQLSQLVKDLGYDVKAFDDCVAAGTYKDRVSTQYQDAVASGGRGTPYSVVIAKDGSKQPLSGALPIAQIKAMIDPLVN